MSKKTLVTAALPYANGSIHIGHLVEYIMTDVFVRSLKLDGKEAYYVCADDTHGTPIELNASKAGIPPEEFIARYAKEHLEDFTSFGIEFDFFGSTNSEENRKWVYNIYAALRENGHIVQRPLNQLYDEQAKRFLPDRFVKGTCPKCGTPDQYGDVCEACGATYEPTELKNPVSAITGTTPIEKESEHVYVTLKDFTDVLKEWVSTPGVLQPETRKFCETWIEGGLQDWCVSRDAPYFGFEIPDMPGKFFYVWIDAPVGYISSTEIFGKQQGNKNLAESFWRDPNAEIIHVIGKDIIYFHTLFWPAMLSAANLKLPSRVHVHGMLTVDGVKMSKSRGTFIMARTFRDHLDPSYLRYYFASKIGPKAEDVDLSLEEFVHRVNAELVNNFANLVARGVPFIKDRLGGQYGDLPDGSEEHLAFVKQKVEEAQKAYANFDLASATRAAVEIANLGNKLFQDFQPWKKIKEDEKGTRDLVTLCLNIARSAWVLLAPINPSLCEKVYGMLGLEGRPGSFDEAVAFDLVNQNCGDSGRIIDRITGKQVAAMVEASKDKKAAAKSDDKKKSKKSKKEKKPTGPAEEISIDDFIKIDLRVGLIRHAELVEGADKLLQLTVDLGEEKPRNIFAGIRSAYEAKAIIGKKVAVVANLAPRKMRFGISEGMVMAAGPGGKDIWLLEVSDDAPIGSVIK
ncbi:MAG: methionine--tRNA ligase [Myxococcota bacterium]|nr:methionine--tRNA ligase [Myxococcota bacterium]